MARRPAPDVGRCWGAAHLHLGTLDVAQRGKLETSSAIQKAPQPSVRPMPYQPTDAPTSPATRCHLSLLPPEILTLIIVTTSATHHSKSQENDPRPFVTLYDYPHSHSARNAILAPLALVSRAFQQATYSVLYADLRLRWLSSTVTLLRVSLSANLDLLGLVRRLEVTAVPYATWHAEKVEAAVDKREEDIESDYFQGVPNDSEEAWEQELDHNVRMDWYASGNARWSGAEGVLALGAHEVLELLDIMPNVQAVVIRGFEGTVCCSIATPNSSFIKAFDTFVTCRLFRSIQSLDASNSCPFNPDPCSSFASFLASRSPNLRRMCGTLPDKLSLSQILPGLTHLDIQHTSSSSSSASLTALLTHTQSTLQSLRLTPRIGAGWANSLLPYITTLESFTLDTTLHASPGSLTSSEDESEILSIELEIISSALSNSPSLRHVGLEAHRKAWEQMSKPILNFLTPQVSSLSLSCSGTADVGMSEARRVVDQRKVEHPDKPISVELVLPAWGPDGYSHYLYDELRDCLEGNEDVGVVYRVQEIRND
ncbi:hypothetical protein P7C70_g8178, partial [Phenoliferia sp. Uapishka_3]